MSQPCPCDSGKTFLSCCQPLLTKKSSAQTPEQLMRSRYSAYALGGYGDYLLATWFAPMAKGLNAKDLSKKSTEWLGLKVINSEMNGDEGSVEFKGFFRQEGELAQMHEKSIFTRVAGHWFYIGGEVSNSAVLNDVSRNDPCPCGSGKKYKKCCLAQ